MTKNFVPAPNPPANLSKPVLWFAFSGTNMLHREEGQIIPTDMDFLAEGIKSIQQYYLGTYKSQHCFAIELPKVVATPKGMVFNNLRQAYGILGDELFVVAGRAIQIVDWGRNHQFCGRCGAPTDDHPDDRAKVCTKCGLTHYPRLSPSIIVRITRSNEITKDDEILLARAINWPENFYSVLAGFVEPGETLEQAVAREVMEEVGITVKNIKYFGSQPWPFPNSLMIAYVADYANGFLLPDPTEIAEAAWFPTNSLPNIPSSMSISRWLIDDFIKRGTLTG